MKTVILSLPIAAIAVGFIVWSTTRNERDLAETPAEIPAALQPHASSERTATAPRWRPKPYTEILPQDNRWDLPVSKDVLHLFELLQGSMEDIAAHIQSIESPRTQTDEMRHLFGIASRHSQIPLERLVELVDLAHELNIPDWRRFYASWFHHFPQLFGDRATFELMDRYDCPYISLGFAQTLGQHYSKHAMIPTLTEFPESIPDALVGRVYASFVSGLRLPDVSDYLDALHLVDIGDPHMARYAMAISMKLLHERDADPSIVVEISDQVTDPEISLLIFRTAFRRLIRDDYDAAVVALETRKSRIPELDYTHLLYDLDRPR